MSILACSRQNVVSAEPDATISRIIQLMQEKSVGSVVITDLDLPVGIITDRDILLRVIAEKMNPDETFVREVMTRDPVMIREDTGVYEAIRILEGKWFRRLPIVDDQGILKGIVSIDDLMRLLIDELSAISSILKEQSPTITTAGG
ncbi:MAG TPA: CBS domain-containing protein [Methanomicrobiales archaeon]|nr:CBS domain-containing protein [Methanomicrobiales archaeon]